MPIEFRPETKEERRERLDSERLHDILAVLYIIGVSALIAAPATVIWFLK